MTDSSIQFIATADIADIHDQDVRSCDIPVSYTHLTLPTKA